MAAATRPRWSAQSGQSTPHAGQLQDEAARAWGCLGCPPRGPYRHTSPPGRRLIAWQPWVAHPTGRGRCDACAGWHTAGTQLMLIERANDCSLADPLEGTRLCPRGLGPRLLRWKQESLWTHSPSRPCSGEGGRDTQLGGEAGNISPLCGGLTMAGTTGQGLLNRPSGRGRKGWTPTRVSMARLLGTTTALMTQAWARAPGSPLPSLLITRSQGSQEFTVNNWETMEKRWAGPDVTDGRTDRHRRLRGATAGSRALLATEVPADYNQAGLRRSRPGRTPAPQAARHHLLQQRFLLFGAEHGLPASCPQSPHPRLTLVLLQEHLLCP